MSTGKAPLVFVFAMYCAINLTGCGLGLTSEPDPAAATSQQEEQPDAQAAAESAETLAGKVACAGFDGEMNEFDSTVTADSSGESFTSAYKELSFGLADLAAKASKDSDVQVALLTYASVVASAADEIRNAGGLSTSKQLEIRVAGTAAADVCDVNWTFE